MDVNVTGMLFTIQATLADLRGMPGATVVTIASVGAKRPGAGGIFGFESGRLDAD
jgi:NADP-dependent 3-hydroxy acid dehydrogenase YdfG